MEAADSNGRQLTDPCGESRLPTILSVGIEPGHKDMSLSLRIDIVSKDPGLIQGDFMADFGRNLRPFLVEKMTNDPPSGPGPPAIPIEQQLKLSLAKLTEFLLGKIAELDGPFEGVRSKEVQQQIQKQAHSDGGLWNIEQFAAQKPQLEIILVDVGVLEILLCLGLQIDSLLIERDDVV